MTDSAGKRGQTAALQGPRTSGTDLPFVPFGLVPLIGLVIVLWLGLVPFAKHVIEQTTERTARGALAANGADWARPVVSGQHVRLVGRPPSRLEGEQVLAAVRQARAPTWLGGAAPVTQVTEEFLWPDDMSAEAPSPEWTFRLADGVLSLEGQVPDLVTRRTLIEAADLAIDPPRITSTQDKLVITNVASGVGYLNVALRGVNAVGKCDRGVASFIGENFSLSCELPDAEAETVRKLVGGALPVGRFGNIDILPNEAVISCETALARLLEDTHIQFAPASAAIDPRSDALLQAIAEAAAQCPGTLRIEGHTDSMGSDNANELLGDARAEAVRDALIARGLPESRLVAVGFGAGKPIADNSTSAGRARNRRIEIRVVRASD